MLPDIDYPAVVEHLQHENERLRMRVLQLRHDVRFTDILPFDIDVEAVKDFLSDPVKVYIAALLLMVVIVPAFKGLIRFLRRKFS